MSIKLPRCENHIGDSGISDVVDAGVPCGAWHCEADAVVCVDPYDVPEWDGRQPCDDCGVVELPWDHATGQCPECARWAEMSGGLTMA